ncbi:MAG TPA: hypothetical protein VMZ26_13450 [Pyrinomonadaceae bacterium]|nr:hypothetical protein [Pyrinomonadaceae bacterium]
MSYPSESRRELLDRFARIRKDPIEFLRCIRTQDQADRTTPIKPFPVDLDYIRLYSQIWPRERFLAVPKSRRMIMTWTNICLYLWDTMFNVGRAQAFVSKKEDDSDELIKRCVFILQNLDERRLPKELIPKWEDKYGFLNFPEINSNIRGFAQGADQLRQFTFSGILADEMAFWEDAQKMYSGAFPTLEGGGRFTAVSSGAPGFFKKLVHDTIDSGDDNVSVPQSIRKYPIPGIEVWRNPKNKFFVFQLHYSANPHKRSSEWRAAAKSGMPLAQWNQEYEIQWDSFAGMPVYPDFDSKRHLIHEPPRAIPGLPLLRGWDFGLTPACIVAQLVEDQLFVLREYTETNMGAERFSEKVLSACAVEFPGWSDPRKNWRDFIDPSGAFRKDTDEGTCAKILDGHGLLPISGPVAFEARRKAVEYFLLRQTKAGPAFQVCESTAPILVRGFRGGYRYPEKASEIEPAKIRPVKDEHSHPHDGLQYICSQVILMRSRHKAPIPVLNYGGKRA